MRVRNVHASERQGMSTSNLVPGQAVPPFFLGRRDEPTKGKTACKL